MELIKLEIDELKKHEDYNKSKIWLFFKNQ